MPDSQSFLFAGSEPGHELRLYVLGIDGEQAAPGRPEGISAALPGFAVSPDGKTSRRSTADARLILFPLAGDAPRSPGVDGRRISAALLARRPPPLPVEEGRRPARVSRVDVETGKREVWKDLLPADPAGVERISNVLVTPDGKGYAYCYARLLSDLFVVEGLR